MFTKVARHHCRSQAEFHVFQLEYTSPKAPEIAGLENPAPISIKARRRAKTPQADKGVKQAGGVGKWFQGMTAEERLRWSDLKEELLREEKSRLRQAEESARMLEPLTMEQVALMNPGKQDAPPKPKPEPKPWYPTWTPPQALTGNHRNRLPGLR
jgi:hypothetical protein